METIADSCEPEEAFHLPEMRVEMKPQCFSGTAGDSATRVGSKSQRKLNDTVTGAEKWVSQCQVHSQT